MRQETVIKTYLQFDELGDFTKEKLEARLPQLMADFKAEVTKFLEWPTT